jgi:selenocysteine-specific elongation factor
MRRAAGNVLQEELRKYPRGVTVGALLKATLASQADVDKLQARRLGEWLFSDEAWKEITERSLRELASYHAAHPLRSGMAREELRSRLGVPPASFTPVVEALVAQGSVAERNGSLAIPQHEVALETEAADALIRELGAEPLAPPSLVEAMQKSGATQEMVRALAQRGDIVRVSDDLAFTKDAYVSAIALVREIIASTGSITVAQLRDRMRASRRPALALLEHLDSERVTRRVGDTRVLR